MKKALQRTYVDAGVLIAATRGIEPISQRAMHILDDPERAFVSSMFVKLEVLPKAVYHHQEVETLFYQTFFEGVAIWADDFVQIAQKAYEEACDSGINALDALHVAAAASIHADELITSERLTKPIHRAKSVRVISIHPADEEEDGLSNEEKSLDLTD